MRRLALATTIACLAAPAGAVGDLPAAAPPGRVVAARSLSAWTVRWNRWRLALPAHGASGECLDPQQTGPVWFLSYNRSADHVITVRCTIPAGRSVLLGQPQVFCTTVVPTLHFKNTRRGLERCARHYWHEYGDPRPRLVVDGVAVLQRTLVRTPVFNFSMPKRDNLFSAPGTHGRAAAVGLPALVGPLSAGSHKIVEGVRYRGDANRVIIYRLTVV